MVQSGAGEGDLQDGVAGQRREKARAVILEVTQYLENYLWPNLDTDAASFEHVISMILMVNEKVKYNCCEVHIQSIKFLFLLILFIIVQMSLRFC